MSRTAAGKRIRTKYLRAENKDVPAGTQVETTTDWVVQDDITIIGMSWVNTGPGEPAQLAEAGGYCNVGQFGRGAVWESDASFFTCRTRQMWSLGGDGGGLGNINGVVMFPEGYGIDVDEGEVLHLMCNTRSYQAALATVDGIVDVVVYYVEQ